MGIESSVEGNPREIEGDLRNRGSMFSVTHIRLPYGHQMTHLTAPMRSSEDTACPFGLGSYACERGRAMRSKACSDITWARFGTKDCQGNMVARMVAHIMQRMRKNDRDNKGPSVMHVMTVVRSKGGISLHGSDQAKIPSLLRPAARRPRPSLWSTPAPKHLPCWALFTIGNCMTMTDIL
jgi:hypothetical protein